MSLENIRKKGYLYKLPVKGLVKKWSKRWFVLYATSHEGVIRLEYFDNQACERSGLGKRTIPLRDSSGVNQTVGDKIRPYTFELHSQIGHHVFACDSQPDLEEWVEGIKEALHEDKMKRRKKKTQSLVFNRQDTTDDPEPLETHRKASGTSYTSEIEQGVYRVTMEENETSIKMALRGEYNLEVTPTSISLVGPNSGAVIAVWHYKHLKNYGKQHGRFHFETGKMASTGTGKFVCVTTCSKEIFGVVNRNIKKLRTAKEQAQKESVEKQVQEATASLKRQQTVPAATRQNQPAAAVKKQSDHDGSFQAQNSKRQSREIAGQPTTGKYRSSVDFDNEPKQPLDETDHDPDEFDPSHIYSPVVKPPKSNGVKHQPPSKKADSGPPLKPEPYASTANSAAQPLVPVTTSAAQPLVPVTTSAPQPLVPVTMSAPQPLVPIDPTFLTPFDEIPAPVLTSDSNRFSYGSARDSRDSAFINLQGNFLGSFDEEENIYDDTLSPLMAGANNPIGNESFNVPEGAEDLINFDIDKLGDSFFEKLDQFEAEPPSAGASYQPTERPKPPEKRLSQQQFDQLWDNIFSTIPTNDPPSN